MKRLLLVLGLAACSHPPTVGYDGPLPSVEARVFLPVYTDGDVADLFFRATGERVPEFEGELSEEYRGALGL